MAGMTDLAIRIATTLDSTGINKADKALGKLQRSVRGVSAAIGAVAIAAFAKKSLKAFVDDELAATRLSMAVKNLGLEFANPYITTYISNLEKTSQVADDMLRPSFQRLLQQTGSLAKSQSILNTAIEVSRGSGLDLSSVSEDLAKAYYGQTRSLKKYSLGLTEAELKAKSFSEIQDILNKKFAGSNAAYLDTYAGQISILSLAWNNLQENAGKALFTLAGASGDQSSGARRLGGIMDAFGVGLNEAAKLLNNAAMAFGQAYFGVGTPQPEAVRAAIPGQELFRKSMANDAKLKAIEQRQAKLYKEQLAATKKLTDQQKKQAALKKAGSIFDLEQVGLIAALKGKLSDEDRKRVELQFALITGNVAEATKLSFEIAKAQGLSKALAADLASIPNAKNPFEAWSTYLDMLAKKAALVASVGGSPAMGTNFINQVIQQSGASVPASNVIPMPKSSSIGSDFMNSVIQQSASNKPMQVVVQIDGKAVASSLQNSSLSGIGSFVDRVSGG